jgi:CubicO group peptidase (beta-lactamase class C family)
MKTKRLLILAFIISLTLNSCYIGRFFYWNFADINDYKKFRHLDVLKPDVPFTFFRSSKGISFDTIRYKGILYKLDDFIEQNHSVAFLIIRNDSILYEKYFDGRKEGSYVPSFSMAKSFISALVGITISEGYIKSVDQPITDFLPELKKNDERFSMITIEHLLNMRSGILYKENYFSPFGNVAKGYYGRNLLGQLKTLKIKEKPDKEFEYVSENTQLLAFIVERATGKKIPELLQEKIWKPLGMEYDATWSIDSRSHKEAKAFCCLNACARDFAKFGRLYLHHGKWEGKQVIPEEWVEHSTTVDKDTRDLYYSYQWWHNADRKIISDTEKVNTNGLSRIVSETDKKGKTTRYLLKPMNDFFADGFLGQFIYVYPEKNIIIVRLGKKAKVNWPKFFSNIAKEL